MTKSLNVVFRRCRAVLFGGAEFEVNGSVACASPALCLIEGSTGAGKTMVLAIVAHHLDNPAFRVLKSVTRQNIEWSGSQINPGHVGVVRQNPADNFLGSSVGEEIELAFNISRLDKADFERRLQYYWGQYFDLDVGLLSRPPSRLSSGQQQLLSVLTQLLRQPDLLLADEPISRLSNSNAVRVVKLLSELAEDILICASAHKDNIALFEEMRGGIRRFEVAAGIRSIEVRESEDTRAYASGEALTEVDAERILLSFDAYSRERDETGDFGELPTFSVRTIEGSGRSLTASGGIDLDVFTDERAGPRVSVRDLKLSAGINLMYGDNGAGKTLLGRALGGDITVNPWFSRFRWLYSKGPVKALQAAALGRHVPGGATLAWLHKHRRSHFLSSNPDDVLGTGRTVKDELELVHIAAKTVESRLDFLLGLGIDEGSEVDALSFGQRKLLTFALLRDQYSLLVLDEPFANLSNDAQLGLARAVLERTRSGEWSVVIVTSNRPAATLGILREAAVL